MRKIKSTESTPKLLGSLWDAGLAMRCKLTLGPTGNHHKHPELWPAGTVHGCPTSRPALATTRMRAASPERTKSCYPRVTRRDRHILAAQVSSAGRENCSQPI